MGGRRDCGAVKILVWQVDAEADDLHCEVVCGHWKSMKRLCATSIAVLMHNDLR